MWLERSGRTPFSETPPLLVWKDTKQHNKPSEQCGRAKQGPTTLKGGRLSHFLTGGGTLNNLKRDRTLHQWIVRPKLRGAVDINGGRGTSYPYRTRFNPPGNRIYPNV